MILEELIKECLEKYKNKNIVDESLPFFHYVLQCYKNCNPQSYGPKIEKRIIKEYNLGKIKKSKGLGDFYIKEDSIISTTFKNIFKTNDTSELKISFLSGLNKSASFNFIQLRPYENFNFYTFVTIDFDLINKNIILEWYLLKKDVVHNEFKTHLIHGGEETNRKNKNKEYKLHIVKNSEDHKKLKEYNLLK